MREPSWVTTMGDRMGKSYPGVGDAVWCVPVIDNSSWRPAVTVIA